MGSVFEKVVLQLFFLSGCLMTGPIGFDHTIETGGSVPIRPC